MALGQTARYSGEGLKITIDGTEYVECQEVSFTPGQPRLANARASKDLRPVDKEIGMADDQPLDITGLVANENLMSLGGKNVTIIILSLSGGTSVLDADVRIRSVRRQMRHGDMDVLNITGNAYSIRYPAITHLDT